MSEITKTLTKYSADLNSCKFMLQLFTTHAKNLPASYTLDAKLMGQPWTNGTGFEIDLNRCNYKWYNLGNAF